MKLLLAVMYPPLVPPILLLAGVLVIAIVAVAVRRQGRRKRVRWLTALARERGMTFSPTDRFDLTRRLAALPEWTAQAVDLVVTDVLYAASRTERRFVATATYRRTRDERPHRFVFTCAERLPENELDPDSVHPAQRGGMGEHRYREVMEYA